MQPEAKRTYVTLDGMRGLAALAVVMWHASGFLGWAPAGAYLAVDLFFVLSGFVIAHAYTGRLDSGLSTWAFMVIRIKRLYPLFALGMAIAIAGLGLKLVVGRPLELNGLALAINTFGLPSLAAGALYPMNKPMWSLFFEMVANLMLVALWPLIRGRRIMVLILAGLVALTGLGIAGGNLDGGYEWATAPMGLARVVFSFFLGVLLYRFKDWRPGLKLHSLAVVSLLALAFCTAGHDRTLIDLALVVLIFPALVLLGARVEPGPRLAKVMGLVGSLSYPIYAIHLPILQIIAPVLERAGMPAKLIGAAFLVLAIGGAWAALRLFDAPVQALIKERADVNYRARMAARKA